MAPKYYVHPGLVQSKWDYQRHYVPADQLMRLYRVNPKDCEIIYDDRSLRGSENLDAIHLYPKYAGNYDLP